MVLAGLFSSCTQRLSVSAGEGVKEEEARERAEKKTQVN